MTYYGSKNNDFYNQLQKYYNFFGIDSKKVATFSEFIIISTDDNDNDNVDDDDDRLRILNYELLIVNDKNSEL